jgi:hypothetical protein
MDVETIKAKEAAAELIEMMLEENDKRSKMNIASYPIIQEKNRIS